MVGSHGLPLNQWSHTIHSNKLSHSWLKGKTTFQSVMEITLEHRGISHKHLSLSDSGSTGSFLVKSYASHIGLAPAGRWSGNLTTLMGCAAYSCDFYKVTLKVVKQEHGSQLPTKVITWALETPKIGQRLELPSDIVSHLCQHYKCTPSQVSTRAGNFASLLGLDTQRYLLKEITHIDNVRISNPPHLANMSLQWSPLSDKMSLVGCVGGTGNQAPEDDGQTFGIQSVVGQFSFFDAPSPEDRASISNQYQFSSVALADPGLPQPSIPQLGFQQPSTPPTVTSTIQDKVEPSQHEVVTNYTPSTAQPAPTLARRRKRAGFTWPNPSILLTLITMGLAIVPPRDRLADHHHVQLPVHLSRRGFGHQHDDLYKKPSCCRNPFPLIGKLMLKNPRSVTLWLEVLQADVDPLIDDDLDSMGLQLLFPCDSCKRRILSCPSCKSSNSPLSEINKIENKLILDNISIVNVEGQDRILFSYPFKCNFEKTFRPELSNREGALATTRSLFKKLHAKGLVSEFHNEIQKGISDKHLKLLTLGEANDMLKQSHAFSFLNYTLKPSSQGHKLRPVSNSSSTHTSGSVNSWLPKGSATLCDLVGIFEGFRLNAFALVSDIKRCYRSILSCPRSNRARLHAYPIDPLDQLNTTYTVLMYLVATYGDQGIATCLEQIMLHFIAPRVKDPLGRIMVLSKRYVDDLLFTHNNKEQLVKAMLSVEVALNSLGFSLKMVLSNSNWHYDLPDLHSYSKPWQKQPTTNDTEEPEVIFGHEWDHANDLLKPNFKLYTGKKSRGSYSGDILERTNVAEIVVTKRLVSSLTAQIYELDGCWSSILKTHLKILFSKCCQLTTSWTENLTRTEVGALVLTFLQTLKEKIHLIPSVPRCIVPLGFTVTQLNTFSDGSSTSSSYTIFLGLSMSSTKKSHLARACSKQKAHSVPCCEACGLWLGVESTVKYYLMHHDIFKHVKRIVFSLDSECVLYALNPQSPSVSVLIRNVAHRVHCISKELTRVHAVEVLFAHVESLKNPSDFNSKWCSSMDPITLSLESMWLHGPPELCSDSYPPASKTFMAVRAGEIYWLWSLKAPPSANMSQYFCSHPMCMMEQTKEAIRVGMAESTPFPRNILGHHTGISAEGILTWVHLLKNIPLLSDTFYDQILTSYRLDRMTSAVCKILQVYLPEQVKTALKWQDSWTTFSSQPPSSPSTLMAQLAFLTMLKKSWQKYGFDEVKGKQGEVVEGIVFASFRLSQSALHKVFKTNLVPIIPGKDSRLFFRLFNHAHIAPMGNERGVAHLPGYLSLSRMRSGPYACLTSRQGARTQALIKSCVSCNRQAGGLPFTHTLGPPMLQAFVGVMDPLFAAISIDILGGFVCSQYQGSRGKNSTFTVSVLVAECMGTRNMSFILLEDSKASSIKKALVSLFIRHRTPAVIVADHDSSFISLLSNSSFASDLGIKITIAEARHQFVNYVESGIKGAKAILKSLREDVDKSIFSQSQTVLSLARKLELTSYIIGFTPILKNDFPGPGCVTARHFSRLLISPQQDLSDVQSILNMLLCNSFEVILDVRKNMRSLFQASLISHLSSSAIRYNPQRLGDTSKVSSDKHVLEPVVGDIVLSRAHDDCLRIGRVMVTNVDINQHIVKMKWYSEASDLKIHSRKMSLLFRPASLDSDGFPRVDKEPVSPAGPVQPPQVGAALPLPQELPGGRGDPPPPVLLGQDGGAVPPAYLPRPDMCHDLARDLQEPVLPLPAQQGVDHVLYTPIYGNYAGFPLGLLHPSTHPHGVEGVTGHLQHHPVSVPHQ